MDPQPLLATDGRSLNELRRQAGADPKSAVRAAAGQFESIFMRQMLKAMRDAVPKSGMLEGTGGSTYTDMLDQQLAQTLSGRPGGLADVIARQLTRQVGGAAGAPTAPQQPPAEGKRPWAVGAAGSTPGAGPGFAAGAATASSARPNAPAMPSQAVIRQALAAFVATGGQGAEVGSTGAARPDGPGTTARWSTPVAGGAASQANPDVRHLSGPQADFVRKVWPHALLAEKTTGVPAAFIVGQAALESGWGRHEIRNGDGTSSFNLFGIKANPGWQGQSAAAATTEYAGAQATRRVERFRSYGSYSEAFQDWAGMMARNPRYSGVMQSAGNVQAFAANMQRAGYATDPAYGAKLEKTIQKTLALQRLVT